MLKRFFILILIVLASACQNTTPESIQKTSFYFSAHPDDWQLFMGEKAWEDVKDPNTKVVFILTTAGDAALGMGTTENANMPYYQVRERGYLNALAWLDATELKTEDSGRSTIPIQDFQLEDDWFSLQPIKTFKGRNVTSYLLMLPDGFPNGEHRWSLEKLKNKLVDYIPSIDSVNIYDSWEDLRKMIELLIDFEMQNTEEFIINLAERDTALNPNDHSDHRYTSLLGEEAMEQWRQGSRRNGTYRYYREYHMANLESNLNRDQASIKRFLFSANAISKEQAGYDSPWDDHHLALTARSYFREVKKD